MATTHSAPCFFCGSKLGTWNEPASATHPSEASRELEALRRRCAELERGEVRLEDLRGHLLAMCTMCQGSMLDLEDREHDAQTRELIERITYRIHRLELHREAS